MRTIFINGRFLSQPVTGTQRYSREFLGELDSLLAKSEAPRPPVVILVPASVKTFPNYHCLTVSRVGRFSGQAWEQLELPFYAKEGILFTPCGGAPIMHRRNIITIHDAAVIAAPQGYSLAFRTWYQVLNRALCRLALHIMTVSHFSKSELVKWYGADPQKITITYLGSEHALRPAPEPRILSENLLSRFQYVLLVGSKNPNKNLVGLLRALPYLDLANSGMQVAIAGPTDPKVFGDHQIAHDKVRDLGYVNDSELRTLYESAACFVFPSFYEGFGLPPLEALALGCPAIVANTTAMSEIFSGIAFLCDPNDPSDIAEKIVEASQVTQESRSRNREFAAGFRWAECAKTTWDLLFSLSQV